MLSFKNNWIVVVVFGILFGYLFYNHGMGLNTLIFAILVCIYSIIHNTVPQTQAGYIILLGFLLSAVGVITGHTSYSLVFYWLNFLWVIGVCAYPKMQFSHRAFVMLVRTIFRLPNTTTQLSLGMNNTNNVKQSIRFVVLPAIIFLFLLILYAASNPHFEKSIQFLFNWMPEISIGYIGLLLLGCLFAILLTTQLSTQYENQEYRLSTKLLRFKSKHKTWRGLTKLLLRKQQIAITFFGLINIMAIWLNIMDIRFLWLDFTWDGGYLKDMVHQGTYLLILAILISIGVALYYLNSNIIWISRNRQMFKILIIVWLIQNAIMVLSVALRNTYYIEYFALAYKRIFVYYFLVACLVGIGTIIYKIVQYKNTTYLLHINTLSVYIIFLSACFFNWDAIIARYNFLNYQTSFIHYSFLSELNDAALPYLIEDTDTLSKIDSAQVKQFEFSKRGVYQSISYPQIVADRKLFFTQNWEERSWQDWNYPEANAYKLLHK